MGIQQPNVTAYRGPRINGAPYGESRFPYDNPGNIGPYSDGLISSAPNGREIFLAPPNQETFGPPKNRDKMIASGIGNTDYVYCIDIQYGIFGGTE